MNQNSQSISQRPQKRVALVTGAGKRLGREFAVHAARHGYHVAVHFNRSSQSAEETCHAIRGLGCEAELFQGDLSRDSTPKELVGAVQERFGSLDLLVNSASTFPSPNEIESNHDFLAETALEWEEALAVNAKAPFLLMKHAAPILGTNGIIINILDETALRPARSRVAHSVSKSALLKVTELGALSLACPVYGLLLGNILPGEAMSETISKKIEWIGVEPVLSAFTELLKGELPTGTVSEVLKKNASRTLRFPSV